jgi:hypothetical protein
MPWQLYNPQTTFKDIKGFDKSAAKYMDNKWNDVYIATCKIPEF